MLIDEREDLELAVLTQLVADLFDKDISVLKEWLEHLSDECLLHYLPQDHQMFEGLRPSKKWYAWQTTIPFDLTPDYLDDILGSN